MWFFLNRDNCVTGFARFAAHILPIFHHPRILMIIIIKQCIYNVIKLLRKFQFS